MSGATVELSEPAYPMEIIFFFLAGMAAAALLFLFLAWLVEKVRNRAYVPLPAPAAGPVRSDHELLKELLKSSQQLGVDLQSRVVARALSCGILLTLSFMLFSAKIIFFSEFERVRWFAMAFDLSVLALVLWTFLRSEGLRNAWIAARVRVEFARQWATVDYILVPSGNDARAAYQARWAEIRDEVPNSERIGERVALLWEQRLVKLGEKLLSEGHLRADSLRLYLDRRPRRQARWFEEAQARTSRPRQWRERWLRVTFAICATITLIELLAQLHLIGIGHEWEGAGNFIWLSTIALATLLVTSLYGQNSRGLLHRYSSQRRLIGQWMRDHGTRIEAEIKSPDSVPRHELVRAVDAFERIMGDELLDWIEITRRDTAELAPV